MADAVITAARDRARAKAEARARAGAQTGPLSYVPSFSFARTFHKAYIWLERPSRPNLATLDFYCLLNILRFLSPNHRVILGLVIKHFKDLLFHVIVPKRCEDPNHEHKAGFDLRPYTLERCDAVCLCEFGVGWMTVAHPEKYPGMENVFQTPEDHLRLYQMRGMVLWMGPDYVYCHSIMKFRHKLLGAKRCWCLGFSCKTQRRRQDAQERAEKEKKHAEWLAEQIPKYQDRVEAVLAKHEDTSLRNRAYKKVAKIICSRREVIQTTRKKPKTWDMEKWEKLAEMISTHEFPQLLRLFEEHGGEVVGETTEISRVLFGSFLRSELAKYHDMVMSEGANCEDCARILEEYDL